MYSLSTWSYPSSSQAQIPGERSVFGWPAPGYPYWDEQTLADTQTRDPRADLTPYR